MQLKKSRFPGILVCCALIILSCGDDEYCPEGKSWCWAQCVDLVNDEDNCGACCHACRADQICDNGTCSCYGSMQECGGECVDTMTDPDHCGACFNKCPPGSDPCVTGACSSPQCLPWEIRCSDECADAWNSNDHCGACFNACDVDSGFACNDGECECLVGRECAPGVCIDTDTDEQNCGACGRACRADQVCKEGQCGCPEGLTECGDPGICVDTMTHHVHCGVCDFNCPTEEVCVLGVCIGDCPPPAVFCGSDCDYLQTSNSHCGQCDNPCDVANGFICQGGICDCLPGLDDCYGYCVNLEQDVMNCGSCRNTCRFFESCIFGSCIGDPYQTVYFNCPEHGMPMGTSMQCTVIYPQPGGLPPVDITDQMEWHWEECETAGGCVDGPVIESVVDGLVSTVDSGGTIGDRAFIYALYMDQLNTGRLAVRLIEQPSAENFVAGAVLDPCLESLPICTTTAGCVLDEDEYLEGDFPGFISFIANASPGEVLVVKVFFSTQEDPGNGIHTTFYDAGCAIEIAQGPLNDIFEAAGLDWTLEFSQGFAVDDLHLVEVTSDATTHFYLRVEIQ